MKTYTNLKKIFLVRVFFWLKYIFRINFKIPILDLMLLPKTVFHLKGYTAVRLIYIAFIRFFAKMLIMSLCHKLYLHESTFCQYQRPKVNTRMNKLHINHKFVSLIIIRLFYTAYIRFVLPKCPHLNINAIH